MIKLSFNEVNEDYVPDVKVIEYLVFGDTSCLIIHALNIRDAKWLFAIQTNGDFARVAFRNNGYGNFVILAYKCPNISFEQFQKFNQWLKLKE